MNQGPLMKPERASVEIDNITVLLRTCFFGREPSCSLGANKGDWGFSKYHSDVEGCCPLSQNSRAEVMDRAKQIKFLFLDRQHVRQLPNGICMFSSLTHLSLANNQLHSVPTEICHVKQLEVLNLSGNYLCRLPKNIHRLQHLRELNASCNGLNRIPREIGKISSLESLDVSDNRVVKIPAEIQSLVNLKRLLLHRNAIRQLPQEIGALVNLQVLTVENNDLRNVPWSLGQLPFFAMFELSNNPFRAPPFVLFLPNETPKCQMFVASACRPNSPMMEPWKTMVRKSWRDMSVVVRSLHHEYKQLAFLNLCYLREKGRSSWTRVLLSLGVEEQRTSEQSPTNRLQQGNPKGTTNNPMIRSIDPTYLQVLPWKSRLHIIARMRCEEDDVKRANDPQTQTVPKKNTQKITVRRRRPESKSK